jgi:hypothetical protein
MKFICTTQHTNIQMSRLHSQHVFSKTLTTMGVRTHSSSDWYKYHQLEDCSIFDDTIYESNPNYMISFSFVCDNVLRRERNHEGLSQGDKCWYCLHSPLPRRDIHPSTCEERDRNGTVTTNMPYSRRSEASGNFLHIIECGANKVTCSSMLNQSWRLFNIK